MGIREASTIDCKGDTRGSASGGMMRIRREVVVALAVIVEVLVAVVPCHRP